MSLNAPDILAGIIPIVDTLQQLGVAYQLGGSLASSIQGIPRLTFDADIVADLRLEHVQSFVQALETAYYIDADIIKDAIRRESSFNIIHLETMLKVDVFILKARAFDQEAFRRPQQRQIPGSTRFFNITSPEDIMLNKLEWYRMGGEVLNHQWGDVLGVLKVQGTNLDLAYLRRWAATLNVADLLERALDDAGLSA